MWRYLLCLLTIVSYALLPPATAQAEETERGVAYIALPAELSGTLNGVEYKIRVPANWNGTLLVHAHGSANYFMEVAPPTYPVSSPTLDDRLLSAGYALAGSLYKDGDNAVLRILMLTTFFNGAVGKPRRTIPWGGSWGGTVALKLAELYPGIYDGSIAVAPVAAGAVKDADFELRFDLAYAAVFGWPSDWWGPIEHLREGLLGKEGTLIAPVFAWGGTYAQWEFVRLVMKESPQAWWYADPMSSPPGLPGWALVGWKSIALRSASEQVCGTVAQNLGVVYSLTGEEKAYLSGLGLNADQPLAWMNAHTNISGKRSCRIQWQHESPNGNLRRPVIAMHGIYDYLLPPYNEAVYRELVDANGKDNKLVQTFVNVPGHVTFSSEHYLALLSAMEHWLDTGVKPDTSYFPENLGFDNSFVAPPWPY